ncbi:hypothetical protein [Acidilobus sp.]|uniref:hypothetical protein n=1 Tax=Acidilobus sp. TaxID=1872109 RepID=UPI003D01E3D9
MLAAASVYLRNQLIDGKDAFYVIKPVAQYANAPSDELSTLVKAITCSRAAACVDKIAERRDRESLLAMAFLVHALSEGTTDDVIRSRARSL